MGSDVCLTSENLIPLETATQEEYRIVQIYISAPFIPVRSYNRGNKFAIVHGFRTETEFVQKQ